jgi:hypothetical protein
MTAVHRIMYCVLQAVSCALSFVRRGGCQSTGLVPDSSTVRQPRSNNVKELRTPRPQHFQRLTPRSKSSALCKSALHPHAIDAVCSGVCPRGEQVAFEHLDHYRRRTAAEERGRNYRKLVAKAELATKTQNLWSFSTKVAATFAGK